MKKCKQIILTITPELHEYCKSESEKMFGRANVSALISYLLKKHKLMQEKIDLGHAIIEEKYGEKWAELMRQTEELYEREH